MKSIGTLTLLLILSAKVFSQQADNALLLDYIQNQKYKEAATYLKSVYPEPITDDKVLQNLAYTSRMSGNLPDAESYYLRLFQKDSTKTAVLFSLGNINMARQNKQKALAYYKKIITIDSTNFSVYVQLATLSQIDTINYINYLQKANNLNPIDADVAGDLSEAYIARKKPEFLYLAEKVLQKALVADTANLSFLKTKAELLFKEKKYKETIEACTHLMANGDKSSQVIIWLGISYYNLRQYQLCLNTYVQIPEDKRNEGIDFYMAMCYRALNDNENAIVYFKRAIKDGISYNVTDYYIDMGDCYETMHQAGKALAAYQKSLQFEERPLTYYSLANLYDIDFKDSKIALKYYKKYLAAKPDPKEEQKFIDYAKSKLPTLAAH